MKLRTTAEAHDILEAYSLSEPGNPVTSAILEREYNEETAKLLVDLILFNRKKPDDDDTYIAPTHLPGKTFFNFFLCYLAHEIWRDKYVHIRTQNILDIAKTCYLNALTLSNRRIFGDLQYLDAKERDAVTKLKEDDDRNDRERIEAYKLMSPEDVEKDKELVRLERVARGGKVGRPTTKILSEKEQVRRDETNTRRERMQDKKQEMWAAYCSTKDEQEQKRLILEIMGEGHTMRHAAMMATNFKRFGFKG